MNSIFEHINGILGSIFFYDVFFGMVEGATMPFIVAWLIIGGVFLTFRFGFINVRMFSHAYKIITGQYKTADDVGEITPFQSLTTALSATVGLGNIAGVAIAIAVGGPGATFWMILAGFFGMTLKFTEVSLAQIYREKRPDGRIMGGAMQYLSKGLATKGYTRLGKVLAVLFAFLAIGGSLGAGNAFQTSQALGALAESVPFFQSYPIAFGLIMALIVGFVIIGGIKRIARTAEKIVPLMVLVYLLASLWILITNASAVPGAITTIFHEAFAPTAIAGGLIGVLVQGFKRAAFSSEAGIGSAAIVHSTASVKYPVRQGMVALYEPFIDTIVICTMTALVIVTTGVYDPGGEFANLVASKQGAALTAAAYGTVISWFPVILTFSIVLFAFSTMISWSYYGERSWTYLFGEKYTLAYKLIFVAFTVIASITSASALLDFSDLLILAMALPNLVGLYILQGDVHSNLKEYLSKWKSGELDRECIEKGICKSE
ncbi:alanine/glycine:cation symporter family protein [Sulfurovum sp. zt1-1]|uniref:Alanine/glycine:cation symporter family protein n=1 Tax=Sulfurovum zhangzhouensis TaxID=3019067 RepID=A0ABT7R0I4_9BACT|nr:alanine/glycine:cation symporter family protein [Sulfurovum zhangzhouensis]MDM5272578.1 alanine/glycine:cation symporter family protein [Sulfurovum zhangzhouensis]